MNQRKYLIKIISGVVIGGLLFSTGANVFASDSQGASNKKPPCEGRMDMGGKDHFKGEKGFGMKGPKENGGFVNMLSELVKDGTLTQNESDKIAEYMNKKQEQRKAEMDKIKSMTPEERKSYFEGRRDKKQDILSELVSNGILTQEKADVVKNKLAQKQEENRKARLNEITNKLNELVEKGTISKEQVAKVIEGIKQQESERKAEMDKIKSMTKDERDAYFKSLKGQKGDFLKKLVDDKTLTQEQANAIRKVIRMPHGKDMPRIQKNNVNNK